jgi:hypothetical protein
MVYASTSYGCDAVNRFVLLILLLPVAWALEVPPTERAFRFLVVDEDGKPANDAYFFWLSEVEDGRDLIYGGRTSKVVMRKIVNSANDGVVDIPKHTFTHFQVSINQDELNKSKVWMVDRTTNSQSFRWDVYRNDNPYGTTEGPPTPGFDAVFKVLSKQGISNLYRYEARHRQVPADGTPTPLRLLGTSEARVNSPDEADAVITINRPDQEVFAKELDSPFVAKPLRVPWTLESSTLRFAHFPPDSDLSADYQHRTWTQRLEFLPSNSDHPESLGAQEVRLWALIPGEKPLVVPVKCRICLSYESDKIRKTIYAFTFEIILPEAPCTRYHPDMLSPSYNTDLAPEIDQESIVARVGPIRAAALQFSFPDDLKTTPALRYDTNPKPHGKIWEWRELPVLLPAEKP